MARHRALDRLQLVNVGQHLAALRREGDLLAMAAARTDLDTPIPTCPEWRMRDLVLHVGDVHRWAATHVAEGRTKPIQKAELAEVAGPLPDDEGLLDWFREGHARLLHTLESAEPDTECWTFLPAPSPVAFWARRQAHETGIHRVDAESPGGADRITPFDPDFAIDGIEELLFGFLSRPDDNLAVDPPRTLFLRATDIDGEWLVRLGEPVEIVRDHGEADCTVRGPASELHRLLWNRRSHDGLDVEGDASLLSHWRETVQVRWSRSR
jgi:uncharacterized protein (TIGR03083 family)